MLNFKTSARLTILALFAACTDAEAPTQVLVVIDAEPGVRASSEALEVRVSGPTGDGGAGYHETFSSQDDALIWPRVVALVPKDGDVGREYEVVATARDANGTFVAEVRAISGFIEGEKRQLDLLLEDTCIGKHCDQGESCAAGVCEDAHIPAEELATYSGKDLPEPVNVPFEGRELQLDSGADAMADVDGAVDAGPDGGGDGGSLPNGCMSTGKPACPISCPELCNNEDDDCDDAVDEEEAADDCELSNAVARCQDGLCLVDNCLNLMRNCDGAPENGCETAPDSVNHCTACNVPCNFPNEIAACVSSACVAIGCKDGFADCNATASSCETSTVTLSNCGSCGVVCSPLAHVAVPSCETGTCGAETCQSGHGDCDDVASNGCEQTLDSLAHCAACDVPCDFVGSTDSCATGSCQASSCDSGYDNCDGDPFDGCEPLFNTATNCADCGEVCDDSLDNVASAVCPSMVCELTCEDGFDDCDTTPGNGCEQALDSLNHCGGCNVPCDFGHAAESCATGTCVRGACEGGYGDCNGLPGDGCEQQLNTLAHCGACQTPCNLASCSSGSCTAANCTPPLADCDGDGTSCETNTSGDVNHCGACNAPCQFTVGTPHATISGCTGSACQIQCVGAFASCDADYKNGCETSTQTLANCGACGQPCNIPNAVETCGTGSCKVASCDPGWGNCDANPDTCETNLTTTANCGSCGTACNLLNASEVCAGSFPGLSCQISACDAAYYKDCDTQAATGCEVDTRTDVANCGTCGNDCGELRNVERASCASSACHVEQCAEGFADCDGNPLNGCEHDVKNAGACPGFGYMPRNFDPSGMVFATTYPATCAGDFTLFTSDYTPTAPAGSTCASVQVHTANGHKYFACSDARSHDDAQAQCASIGGNLVTIEDEKEKDFLGSLVGSDTVWIGGNDIDDDGQWRWSRGTKDDGALFWQGVSDGSAVAGLYANWDGAQPDDLNGADCAELSGSAGGLWFDNDCAVAQGYVCELQAAVMDGFAASCGGEIPETRLVTQAGAPDLLVVMLTSLTVNAGVTITLRGSRPVAFAVVGNAVVSGTLDASAAGVTAGAAGGQSCAGSTGLAGDNVPLGGGSGGGGGGGHAVAGAKGGHGGTALPSEGVGGNGGVMIADPTAVPLRGGCSGGPSGPGPVGGVGGGAVQVSVGGTLTLASTARIYANGSNGVSAGGGTNGGGGGGSGGTVLVQGGALSIDSGAQLTAHGGNGGAGSGGGAAGGGRGTAIYKDNAFSTSPPAPNPAQAGNLTNGGGGGGGGFGRVVVPPPGT